MYRFELQEAQRIAEQRRREKIEEKKLRYLQRSEYIFSFHSRLFHLASSPITKDFFADRSSVMGCYLRSKRYGHNRIRYISLYDVVKVETGYFRIINAFGFCRQKLKEQIARDRAEKASQVGIVLQ